MSQLSSQVISDDSFVTLNEQEALSTATETSSNKNNSAQSSEQLESVMGELNRLSKSFVNSYQTLENQVEKLNGQLINESQQKNTALQEKQRLLEEKASLSDRLQNLLAIMPAGVVVIDAEGRIKECNAMATELLGRPLMGQKWVSIIQRAFQPQADDGHQVSLKDGRKIHIETRALDSEPGQLVLLTDLTKTRELQAELSQQQKLSSMGKMIASLAHQIRTPLSAAILYGSHIADEQIEDETKKEFSGRLMERLHFIERQINDMLNFMKGERKQKSTLAITNLYQTLVSMSQGISEDITFSLDSAAENFAVYADQDALLGAIVNLIENACQACEKQDSPEVKVDFNIGRELSISVKDNGVGLTESQKKKIFEPFYTSKKQGNGLGLAIVYGVVLDHRGQIKVDSIVNQGSEFKISLPLLSINKEENLHEL
ncbi:ATP-binding protein [Aliikangiella sp. IMCC44653]